MERLIDTAREAAGGLEGQAVDEIDIDAVEAERARLGDQVRAVISKGWTRWTASCTSRVEITEYAQTEAIGNLGGAGFRDAGGW